MTAIFSDLAFPVSHPFGYTGDMDFHAKLGRLMREADHSGEMLGEVVGVSRQTVDNWRKDTFPRADQLKLIADHYGVSADWLLDDAAQWPYAERPEVDPTILQLLRSMTKDEAISRLALIFPRGEKSSAEDPPPGASASRPRNKHRGSSSL